MPQITLYVDEQTSQLMRAAARAAGVSLSRWVSELIRRHVADEWPDSVHKLAGVWADDDAMAPAIGADVPREPL
jgi:hypothetical protein